MRATAIRKLRYAEFRLDHALLTHASLDVRVAGAWELSGLLSL